MTESEDDPSGVAEPFRWLSPREIIEDGGPDPAGDREPLPASPQEPSSSAPLDRDDETTA